MAVFRTSFLGWSAVWAIPTVAFSGEACPVAAHAPNSNACSGFVLDSGFAAVVGASTVLLERPRKDPRL